MNGSDIRMPDNGRDNRGTTATAALAAHRLWLAEHEPGMAVRASPSLTTGPWTSSRRAPSG